jgi:hypothetical protein
MRCAPCGQPIRPGMEEIKRVEIRKSTPECYMPCDDECEVGKVHCWNVHRPNHKPDWHSTEDCPGPQEKVYGENMPDGPLKQAAGTLVEVRHQKCHWVVAKRVRRGGDAVQGTRPGLLDIYADDDE